MHRSRLIGAFCTAGKVGVAGRTGGVPAGILALARDRRVEWRLARVCPGDAPVDAHGIAGGFGLAMGPEQGCAGGTLDTVDAGGDGRDGDSVGVRLGQAVAVNRAVITGDVLRFANCTCSRQERPLRPEIWNRLGVLETRRIVERGGRAQWLTGWSIRWRSGSGHGVVNVDVVVAVAGVRWATVSLAAPLRVRWWRMRWDT